MYLKKEMIFAALVFLFAVFGNSQTIPKYSDDRELFIGVAGSGVMPNIVILTDSSNSMRMAIYHPSYHPNLFYDHLDPSNKTSPLLTLEGLTMPNALGFTAGYLENTLSLANNATFDICAETAAPVYTLEYDYKATYTGDAKSNPRRWNITPLSGSWTAANIVNKTVSWGCSDTRNSCTNSTTITGVYSTSPLVITVNPRTSPTNPSTIYINPHWVQTGTVTNTEGFVPVGTCAARGFAATKFSSVKLHGYTWSQNGNNYTVLYELNYLYWLAFHASATDVAEITHWATSPSGAFKHDSAGVDVKAGFYRMRVVQDVLKDVITDLWTRNGNYNFGLYRFSSNGGAEQLENLQNANTPGTLNSYKGSIDKITPDTGTPLAEALADIWVYFKEGQGGLANYQPITASNLGNCSSMTGSGKPQDSCPVKYVCQKNYVIIMTDGQSSTDYFDEAKYADALFKQPVKGTPGDPPVPGWGDGDNHNPATWDGVQPNFSDYCVNQSCWYNAQFQGTDFLDDVAYYIKNNDLFPTTDFPGVQNIETYAIGFNTDNDMLKETAKNGNGEYYTALDYAALKDALSSAITNIMLRNFAFSSYTAPKRVTTAVGEGSSFVGYFMPSSQEVWDGHLQSYTMNDKWFADVDNDGALSETEQSGTAYEMQATCQSITGKKCLQTVSMGATPNWDAADKLSSLTSDRNLYTLHFPSGTPTMLNFTASASIETLHSILVSEGVLTEAEDPSSADPLLDRLQTHTIVNTISNKLNFGDVFHSDIAYVGAPLKGKIYLQNYNPTPECDLTVKDGTGNPSDVDCYQRFRLDHPSRRKVLYVGTNVGIVHMIDANTIGSGEPFADEGGREIWGFIPDEVLPTLKTIAIDKKFSYTADGRMTADDIYCHGATSNPWKTILAFGLKDGGQSFYALDITQVESSPRFFWKFKDAVYSGNSWSKPIIGKIRYSDGSSSYDRWVVIVSGGRAFNNENPADNKGKAVFVLDAANGDVIWMIGYSSTGGADDIVSTSSPELEVNKTTYTNPSGHLGQKHLTKDAAFNYCIPSAISAIDRDNNGYIDSIYFGNVAGNLFKINIANANPTNWKTYLLYQTNLTTPIAAGTITAITAATPSNSYKLTVTSGTFAIGQNVLQEHSDGTTSMGFITDITGTGNKDYWIQTTSDESFVTNVSIAVKPYDPIFLAPAIYTDSCNNYWVNFGTGDRLRSRTNTASGKFVSVKDGASTPSNLTKDNLVELTFSSSTNAFTGSTNLKAADMWGWYFNFPDSAYGEKLFDPDPIVLPDKYLLPHIYFNTYQYNSSTAPSTDCNAPSAGSMHFYEITIDYCGAGTASGYREDGRISGGGMMEGSEFIMIEGTSDVGSVDLPGLNKPPKLLSKALPYTGQLIFLKEKKR